MRNGFALTLDAVIGVIIASAMLTAFFSFYNTPTQQATLHQRYAADTLFVLDQENVVNCTGVDETVINDTINDVIPSEFAYSYNITCFQVNGNTVTQTRNMQWSGLPTQSEVRFAARPIPVFQQHPVTGITRLDNISRAQIGVAPIQ